MTCVGQKVVKHGLLGERLTPTQRIVRCTCGWVATSPRKNGAWMTLKKRLREHIKEAEAKAPRCQKCKGLASSFEPDPYESDLHGNDTPGWYCEACLKESAAEI